MAMPTAGAVRNYAAGCEPAPSTGIPRVGAELVSQLRAATMALGRSAQGRAAEPGAADPALQEVVSAWDKLPVAIREAIPVMVKAAVTRHLLNLLQPVEEPRKMRVR
jgi:hypothetical protein